jgi:hypothetical protein
MDYLLQKDNTPELKYLLTFLSQNKSDLCKIMSIICTLTKYYGNDKKTEDVFFSFEGSSSWVLLCGEESED